MSKREIVIRFQLPETPRKRWLLGGGIAVILAGAVAYASLPVTFQSHTIVTASNLNMNFQSLDGRVTTLETQQAWQAASMVNGWIANFSPTNARFSASYYKDPVGVVHLAGLMDATGSTNPKAFTLPAGYQPLQNIRLTTIVAKVGGAQEICPIDIIGNPVNAFSGNSKGDVLISCQPDTLQWAALDGLSFRAEQ